MPVLSRVLGVTTTAFGVLELVKPDVWAGVIGGDSRSPAMRAWHHTLGARDVVSGLAMTFAPAGAPLRYATVFRIVSDLTDAVGFGLDAPDVTTKGKAVGAAVGYAALNAVPLLGNRR